MMTFRGSFLVACCLTPAIGFSQPPAKPSKDVPKRSATISFANLCVAQLSRDEKSLQLKWPNIAFEMRTREENVQLSRTETRTRTIKLDGRSVPETYTITVPYTETREVTINVPLVVGMHEAEIPMEQVRAWTLAGRRVDNDTLAKQLNSAKHVFAYTKPKDKTFEALDPFYASVMVAETMVLYIDTTAFEIGESPDMTAPTPAPAAPAPLAPAPAAPAALPPPVIQKPIRG